MAAFFQYPSSHHQKQLAQEGTYITANCNTELIKERLILNQIDLMDKRLQKGKVGWKWLWH